MQGNNSIDLNKNELQKVYDNLLAFMSNVKSFKIEKGDLEGYYVYVPKDADSWINYCPNIDYLDGWLFGVVQGAKRKEFKNE